MTWSNNYIQGLAKSAGAMQLGLSDSQTQAMRNRVGLQNQQSVQNGLSGLAKNLGGTTSPLYAMQSARLNAGAGSNTAEAMANVDLQNAQNKISNQFQQGELQAKIAGLGLQSDANDQAAANAAATAKNQLKIAQLNALTSLLPQYYKGASRLISSYNTNAIANSNNSANASNVKDLMSMLGL